MNKLQPRVGYSLLDAVQSRCVAIYGDDASIVSQPLQHAFDVASAASGAIHQNRIGPDIQRLDALIGEYGYVNGFACWLLAHAHCPLGVKNGLGRFSILRNSGPLRMGLDGDLKKIGKRKCRLRKVFRRPAQESVAPLWQVRFDLRESVGMLGGMWG